MEATDRSGSSIEADPLRYNGQIIKEDGPLRTESNRQLAETCAAFKRAIRQHLSLSQKLDRHKAYLTKNCSSSKEIGVATAILASTAAGAAAGCYVGSKVAKAARLAPKPSKIMIGTATGVGAVAGFSAGVGGYIWCTEQQDAFKNWASLWDMEQLEQQLMEDIKKEYSSDLVFKKIPVLKDWFNYDVMLIPLKAPDNGFFDQYNISQLSHPVSIDGVEDGTLYRGIYKTDTYYQRTDFTPDHLKTILIWKRLRYLLSGDIGSLPDPLSNRAWKKYESFINSRIQESYEVLLKEFQIEVGSPLSKTQYGNFLSTVQGKPKTCPYKKFDSVFKKFKKRHELDADGIVEQLKGVTKYIEGLSEICLYAAIKNERAKTAYDASKNGPQNLKGKESL